jgi:uncharacterized LabA/DUF88 family protein
VKIRVAVYIDGFNLYYGALKGEPHRWLDLEALANSFLTTRQLLVDVKYFTAKVHDNREKPGQRARQEKYLRALGTLPKLTIYYGHFQTRTAVRLLEHPPKNRRAGDIGLRSVWLHEEKGSDVNLATQLIADGLRARYDLAIVVSNDGDLKMPVELVREKLIPVGIVNPHANRRRSYALSPRELPTGSFYRCLKKRHIRNSQLPPCVEDGVGVIRCPRGWMPTDSPPRNSKSRPTGGSALRLPVNQHPEGVSAE